MSDQTYDPNFINVGERLRELRQARNLSMRALARQSGLSTNALSMIERGRTSPSVSTLYKLSDAMQLPITAFFRQRPEKTDIVFRKQDARSQIPFENGLWEGLGGELFTGQVEPFMLTLEPGAGSGEFGMVHTGHEFVMCLEGLLEYDVENELYTLHPGDTLIFAANLRHRWRNPGDTTTKAVFVLSEFEDTERPSEYHVHSAAANEDEE